MQWAVQAVWMLAMMKMFVFRIRRNISHANISSGDAFGNKHNKNFAIFVRMKQILDLMLSLS